MTKKKSSPKKAKENPKKRTDGGMRHALIDPNWLGYTGNKQSIITMLLDLIPKHTHTFVDLFGGSGFVGASVYKDRRAERIITNEIEYEWAKLLAFMAAATPEEVIAEYEAVQEQWFGSDERLTEENKERWLELRDFYNARIFSWDSDEEQQKRHAASASRVSPIYNTSSYLMFLAKTTRRATPKFSDNGRRYCGTPNFMRFPDPEKMKPFLDVWHRAYENNALQIFSHNFLDLHLKARKATRPRPNTPGAKHTLVKSTRSAVDISSVFYNQDRFMKLLAELGENDIVYVDPPYLGSQTGYTSHWSAADEISLLALLENLNQNGVKYLLSNNLMYSNSILEDWCRARTAHKDKKHVWILDKTYTDQQKKRKGDNARKQGVEVFISNYPRSASRVKKGAGLVEVPAGRDPYEYGLEIFNKG